MLEAFLVVIESATICGNHDMGPYMHHPGIEYTNKPPAPGEFFHCPSWNADMSVSSCANMWRPANATGIKPLPESRFFRCFRCEIGGSHAGQQVDVASELFGKRICCRCHRHADRIIHDSLCVSCYNREREVIVGANGRGSPPVRHAPLSPRRILFSVDGVVSELSSSRTVSISELFVSVLRHRHGIIFFGFKGRIA